MSNVHQLPAARPFVLNREDGERIWFTNAAMTIKATAATTAGHLCLIETTAPIGHGPPLHVHHDEHEAFYVLEGELDIVCGGERHRGGPGAFAFLPRGIAHTFRVVGDRPARFLTIAVPGGLEGFFRDAGRPAAGPGLPSEGPVDAGLLKQVSERYNAEVIGPPLAAAE